MNQTRIGDLRNKITIQVQSSTKDDYGALIETWTDVKTIWAAVNPINGREYFAAESVNSEITHRVKARYTSGITPDMRVKFGTRYFNILSIINYEERNIELQLMCREAV